MGLESIQNDLLCQLREVAKQKVNNNERFTEFTGIIGELAACEAFGYKWVPGPGHAAFSEEEGEVQIKTRKVWVDGDRSKTFLNGRIGRFGRKGNYGFKMGVLVLLNDDFEIAEVWKARREDIEDFEKMPNQTDKKGRELGLHVRTFIKKIPSEPVYHEDYIALERKLCWK